MSVRYSVDAERLLIERHFERHDALAREWEAEGLYGQIWARRAREQAERIAWEVYNRRLRAMGLAL